MSAFSCTALAAITVSGPSNVVVSTVVETVGWLAKLFYCKLIVAHDVEDGETVCVQSFVRGYNRGGRRLSGTFIMGLVVFIAIRRTVAHEAIVGIEISGDTMALAV